MAITADMGKCDGCATCVESCPAEALTVVDEKVCIDADACVDCGVCVDECPSEALSLD